MREDRSNKSVCEKSMQVMLNVIKLSSLSIAKMSLGGAPPATSSLKTRPVATTGRAMVAQFPGSLRSQEPQSSSKRVSYLIQAGEGIVSQEKCVDGMASAYIKKVHEKNRSEKSKPSAYIIPPPPMLK